MRSICALAKIPKHGDMVEASADPSILEKGPEAMMPHSERNGVHGAHVSLGQKWIWFPTLVANPTFITDSFPHKHSSSLCCLWGARSSCRVLCDEKVSQYYLLLIVARDSRACSVMQPPK